MSDHPIECIVAVDSKNGIAKSGTIPWKSKEDMRFFRKTTEFHVVVMGRTTFFTLPRGEPLPNRYNIVLTSHPEEYGELADKHSHLCFTNSLEFGEIVHPCLKKDYTIFIIGGAQIYNLFFPKASAIWITRFFKDYDCDTFFTTPSLSSLEKDKEIQETREFTINKYRIKCG